MPETADIAASKWTHPAAWYQKKREEHPNLWKWILAWIGDHAPRHILEVGGGDAFLAKYASKYTGIELNDLVYSEVSMSLPKHADIICADWTTMDVSTLIDYSDHPSVFISLAVAEHCESLDTFLDQVLIAAPQYALVSFFSGLCRPRDRINLETNNREQYGGHLWMNKYSIRTIWKWAEANEVKHRCFPMTIQRKQNRPPEAILGLDLSERQDSGFYISDDLLPV